MNIPQHVAIIMDGNGRWAKQHNMPRSFGHSQGGKTVEKICREAYKLGIKYLTIYAFSTENWVRPQEEINTLMNLLRDYMKDCIKNSEKDNIKVRVIGDVSKLDEDLREKIAKLEEFSKKHTGLNFQVAINYGGRDDIRRALVKLSEAVKENRINIDEIDEQLISNTLDTAGIPDPDLIIRTSGEQRLSNFLLWQASYSEMYFCDTYWPDFSKEDLLAAIEYYNRRERRYGGV